MMRVLFICALIAVGCTKPSPPEVVEKPKVNVINLYARLYDSQEVADAEKQYVPPLEKALSGFDHTIRIEAFTDVDGGIESLGIDLSISAPSEKTKALEESLMETLRIAGAPYATQIYVVNPSVE